MIKIIYPNNKTKICLFTDMQKSFLECDRSDMSAEDFDYLNLKKHEHPDYSIGKCIMFEWEPKCNAKLRISESAEFNDCIIAFGDGCCEIYNLKPSTTYFAQVSTSEFESDVISFETEDAFPRFLNIDGVTNARDVGGTRNIDGIMVKYGMLYRGSEMNSHMTISEKGLKCMNDDLKIKSILDLRGSAELVEDVYKHNYIHISNSAYTKYLEEKEINKRIFDFLSVKENYPIYMHCWGGADRTGTVAFMLGLILREDLKVLIDDYELTSLSIWGNRSRNKENFRNFFDKLNSFEGDTIYDKAITFMLECGISQNQINQIRNIMFEESHV